jgi:hypothetical protein
MKGKTMNSQTTSTISSVSRPRNVDEARARRIARNKQIAAENSAATMRMMYQPW